MRKQRGFTLIELLVVIAITAIMIGLSVFGIQGARESARDANRKSDLEQLRSGLEIYKSDCGVYPAPDSYQVDSPLHGTQSSGSCSTDSVYISNVPSDPISTQRYFYARPTVYTYVLCAALEQTPISNVPTGTTCQGASGENCGVACNYYITNP